eukprot:321627-Hanusia_phi.AAC.2
MGIPPSLNPKKPVLRDGLPGRVLPYRECPRITGSRPDGPSAVRVPVSNPFMGRKLCIPWPCHMMSQNATTDVHKIKKLTTEVLERKEPTIEVLERKEPTFATNLLDPRFHA